MLQLREQLIAAGQAGDVRGEREIAEALMALTRLEQLEKFPFDAKKLAYNSRDSDQWHVWLYIDDLKTLCQLQGW